MSLDAGARLGPYEIVSALGAGGMGEVYKARDTRLGRDVALKILPHSIAGDPERLARFEQEARSASALNHPNIVTIYEIGRAEGVAFIAMEYVDGETVAEIVAAGPVPTRRALQIAAQAAEGLAKAHTAGIVHRDLKPENLMVSRDGYVKILDFGLAKLVASQREDVTSAPTMGGARTGSGVILGTIGYMSPEQASGLAIDFRSDQFSFGSVLYEMVTGRKAFRAKTSAETLTAIIREEPTPIASIDAGVPAPLCWIVERCLSKDPEGRYASTHDLVRDIATVRERVVDAPTPSAGGEAKPSGLPAARTRFVGRDRERAAVSALLQRDDVRLLTLTGPGGIGKSRLALEVAGGATTAFPGGVHYLGLATVADPALVPSAISRALGVREGRSSPTEALMEHLRRAVRAPILLVADGFERLVEAAPLMADLVAAGPNLRVLVTSRSPLHVYGEHEFPVPPMGLVERRGAATTEAALASEAVALFAQRAAAVRPDFAVTAENAEVVAEICARLDGLPLAIELAASRVRLLSPSAIRARLEKRLALLTGGARDLPARQQTLRGAIDWSHDLLDPAEQKLFRRLGVFAGGCTLEAAEAVCNARDDLGVDVLGGMEAMVDRSLLQRVEQSGGEPRFTMLETIREYALEQLAESGDEALMRKAHAAYCLVLAEEHLTEGPESPAADFLDRFEAEHDNFRAALDHLTRSGNAEWGLRLGAALFRFWEMREHLAEGSERLRRLLALPGASARTKARARALFAAGVLAGEQGDFDASLGFLEESLAIERERNDGWGIAVTRNALAVILLDRGDVASAAAHFEENAALWRELGDRAAVARSLSNLARAATAQGDFARAHGLHDESIGIFRELGDRTGAAWALDQQADVARERGDLEAAQQLCERSLSEFREIGDPWGIAGTLADLGNLARIRSDFPRARSLYGQSLEIFRGLAHKRGIARLLEGFAGCAASEGEPYAALRLAGAAGALREALGTPLARAERVALEDALGSARRGLTDAESAGAWMQGWGMPLDEAVALAIAAAPDSTDGFRLPRPAGR
jgi:predicted ATPase